MSRPITVEVWLWNLARKAALAILEESEKRRAEFAAKDSPPEPAPPAPPEPPAPEAMRGKRRRRRRKEKP